MTKESVNNLSQQLAQTWRSAQEQASPLVQQLGAQWRSLPPAQRNAVIGALLGGTATGVASAATNGRIVRDLIIGALLGGTAGGAGTYSLSRYASGPSGGFARIPAAVGGLLRSAPSYDADEVRRSLPASPAAAAIATGAQVAGLGTLVGYPLTKLLQRRSALRDAFDNAAQRALATARGAIDNIVIDPAAARVAIPDWLGGLARESIAERATAGPDLAGAGWRERLSSWLNPRDENFKKRLDAFRFSTIARNIEPIVAKDVERKVLNEIYRSGSYDRARALAREFGEHGALNPLARESAVRGTLNSLLPKNYRFARYLGALGVPAAMAAGWAASGD